MSSLHYVDEEAIRGIVERLTRDLFPGTPAFGDQRRFLASVGNVL